MTAVAPSEKRRKGNKGGAGAAAAGGGGGGGIGSAQAHTREDPHHTWNAQLMEACLACDVDAVKRLIERGADPVAAREVPPLSFYTGPIVDQVRQQHQQMQQQQLGATGNANPSAGGGAAAADGSAAGGAPLIDFDAPRGEVLLQQQRSGGGSDAAPGGTAPTPAAVAAAGAGAGAATASAMASLAAAASPDALPPLAAMLLSGLNTPEALEVMRVLVQHGASVNDAFRYTTVTAAAAAAGTVNTGGGTGGGLGGGLDGAGDGGAGTVGGAAAGAGATSAGGGGAGGGPESGASSNANSGRGKASRAPSAELKGRQSTMKSKVFATSPTGGVMGGVGAGGSLATGTVGAAAIQVLEAPKHEESFVTGSVLHYVVAHGDHAQLMRLLLTATAIQPSFEEAAVSPLQTPVAIAAPSILAATASGADGEHSGAEAWAPPMPPLPLPYTLLAAVEAETVVGVLRQQHRHRLVTGGEGTAAGGAAGGGPNASGAAPPSRKSRGVSNAAAAVAAAAAAAAAATPAAPLPVTGPVPPAALVCSISADAVLAALQHLLQQRRTHSGGYYGLPLLLSVYPQQRDPDAVAAPPRGDGKDRHAAVLGGDAAKSAAGAEKSARASASVVAAPCRWWSLPELCGATPAGRRGGGDGVVAGNLSATTAPSGDAAVARRTVLEFDLLDSCGRTAAAVALDRGDALSVRLLDFWGAHVPFDALVNACETRLARACALGDVARVEALLRQGDSLTQISSDGRYTLIHYAAAQPAVLRVLADHGLSVEFENALGESAVASLLRHGTGRNDPRYVQTLVSVATAARSGVAESAPNSAAANLLNSLSSSAVANAVRFAQLPAAVQRNLILCPAPALAALGGANLLAGTAAGSTHPRFVSFSGSATGAGASAAGAAASGAAAAGPAVAAALHPAQPSQPFFGGRELGTWWSFLPPAASTADVLDTLLRAGALMQGFIPDEELDLPYVQFAEQQVRNKSPPPSHSTNASLKGGGGGGGGRRRLGDRGHGSFSGRSPRGRGGDEPYFDVDDVEETATEPGDDGDDDFADEEDDVGDEQQSGDLGDSSSTTGTVHAEKFRSSRTLAATASPGGRVGRGRRSRGAGAHAAAAARPAPLPARLPLRMTPLQHAIFDYHPELIRRLLVDYRVDPMQRDSQGATAVHYAALCSHAPSVLEILFAPQVLNPTGAPLAASAAVGGLKGRAGSNSGAGDGHAVSSAAAAAAAPTSATAASGLGGGGAGHVTEIHMDINAVDMAGRTPLFYAALVGNATAVQRLMRFGGATLLCGKADMDGYTPLHIAVRQRHAEIVEQLIRHSNQLVSNAANGGRGPSADVFAELIASTGGAGGGTAASPGRSSRAGAGSGRRGSHRSSSGLALGAGGAHGSGWGASSGANDVLLNPELLVNVEAEERVTRMTPLEMAIKLQREHQEHLATIMEQARRDADESGSAALAASDSSYAIGGPDPSAAAAAATPSAADKDALLRIVSVLLSEAQASPLRPSGLPNGGALLHRAVADGSVEMAELLLTHYADPNETDDADETPLFLALRLQATAAPATPGAAAAAAAASPPLLSSSSAFASASAVAAAGKPSSLAAAEAQREQHRRRRTALVRVLLQHGAKPYAQSGVHLQTPLHLAAGSLGDADELIRLLFYSLPELPGGGVAGRRRRLDGAGAGVGAVLADSGNANHPPYGSGATGGGAAGAGLGARKRHSSFGSTSGRKSSLERRLRERRGQREQRWVSPTSSRGSHAAAAAPGGASARRKPWATSASAGGDGESGNANERSTSLLDADGADAGGGGGAGLDEQGSLANSSFGNRDTHNSSFASQETFSPEHSTTRSAGGAAAAAAAMDSEYADEHQRLLLRLAQWQTPDHLLAPEQCWLLTDAQGRTPLHILCSRTPRALQRMPAVQALLDDLQAVTRAAAAMASVMSFANDAAAGPGGAGGGDDHLLSLCWRIPDAQGRTPLHAAAQSGFVEAVERVLQQAPRTALAVDVDGRTVLHACALMAASPARETSADLEASVSASLQAPASPTRAVVLGGDGENPSAEESPEEARRAAAAAEAAAEQAARLRGILALLQQAVNAGSGDIPAAVTGLQLHGLPIRRAATDVLPSLSIKTSGAWSSGSGAVGAAAAVPGFAASPPPTAATRRAVMSLVQNSSITTQLQRWQQSRHWGCPGMAAHAVSSSSVTAGLAHSSAAQRASPAPMRVWRAYAQLPDAQGRTALLLAAEVGNVGAARELLRTMQSS